jgi:signal transduction histidine kinase
MGPTPAVHEGSTETARSTDRVAAPGLVSPEAALLDSVVALSASFDMRTVLSKLLTSALHVTGAEFGELAITGPDGEVLELVTGEQTKARAAVTSPAFFLEVPVRVRGTLVGTIELARRTPFTDQEHALVEGLGNAAGFAIDNARSQQHNERRRQWLESSAWLSEALRPPIDVDVALGRIMAVARSISGAAATAFMQWPRGASPAVVRTDGVPREAVDGLLRAPAWLTSQPSDRVDILRIGPGERRAVVLPLRSHVAVPTALVAFFDGSDQLPDPDQGALLESLADHAALALDRVQAVADRADLLTVSERDRASRELHDVVMQRLFATGLQLQGMRASVDDPETLRRIDGAIDGLDSTIRDIRSVIFESGRAAERTDLSPTG